jgi:hypothetical protein
MEQFFDLQVVSLPGKPSFLRIPKGEMWFAGTSARGIFPL